MFGLTRRFAVAATKRSDTWRWVHVSSVLARAAPTEVSVPDYKPNPNETIQVKRARLLYQSRKRGMLENDLLLSTFVDRHLDGMDADLLAEYDGLINSPYSDWDIYYWAVGSRPVPAEYQTRVMELLQEHVRNRGKESRVRQPDLPNRPLQL